MVAVEMRYENIAQTLKFELHAPHLHLSALSAIYHHQPVAEIHYLT